MADVQTCRTFFTEEKARNSRFGTTAQMDIVQRNHDPGGSLGFDE